MIFHRGSCQTEYGETPLKRIRYLIWLFIPPTTKVLRHFWQNNNKFLQKSSIYSAVHWNCKILFDDLLPSKTAIFVDLLKRCVVASNKNKFFMLWGCSRIFFARNKTLWNPHSQVNLTLQITWPWVFEQISSPFGVCFTCSNLKLHLCLIATKFAFS